MQLIVTGRHIDVTEPMKRYAREKLSRIMRDRPHINEVHVIMDVEKYRHRVDLTVRGKNLNLFCREETPDMYASIDGALAKLERQLRRYRERHFRKHKPPPELARGAIPSEEPPDREEPYINQRLAMKPMYFNEALLRMKVERHFFLVFLNAETEMVNLLCRTGDHEIGHLVPKKIKDRGRGAKYQLRVFSEESINPDAKPRLLKKEKRYVEWSTPEEALASMTAEGKKYHFFISTAAQNACVIYQEANGNYALIEPRD